MKHTRLYQFLIAVVFTQFRAFAIDWSYGTIDTEPMGSDAAGVKVINMQTEDGDVTIGGIS